MCGITGVAFFEKRKIDPHIIQDATSSLAHRGPDGEGIKIFDSVALGHRRLSIIDLASGSQPMSNEDETAWIVFNGEIYNYLELRRVLEQAGHRFSTNSDTETVIHAYEEWGENCVKKFRGMFAFAIFDMRNNRLFLARDHFGIKPLYYLENNDMFAFASELQAFKYFPINLEVDLRAVDQFLLLQYIPAPDTIFKDIKKLPPACHLVVNLTDNTRWLTKYWTPSFNPDYSISEKQWLEELDMVLNDSVRAHMISDVPFGVFLSGGVDSSAILAYMALNTSQPVQAFSIGFDEKEYNEIEFAKMAAQRWGAEHHIEIVKPDALAILPELVKHYGEPYGDSSAIPTYYVSQLARRHVPLVLSGDGGDEIFAGYHSYLSWLHWLENKKISSFGTVDDFFRRVFPSLRISQAARRSNLNDWMKIISYFNHEGRRGLWRDEHQVYIQDSIGAFTNAFKETKRYGAVNRVQHLDINTYLPFDILTKVDVASMMHGLEVRPPFVDINVFEFASRIPERFNISKVSGEWKGKLLLKKVMEKYFDSNLLYRSKMGFGVPVQKWFASDGSLRGYVEDTLLSKKSNIFELFKPETIRQTIHENGYGRIWFLIFLEEWLNQFKKQKIR
jgi:asparagine synthase (glutamine-hydrolysing)